MCRTCIIDGWYEDQPCKNVMELAASVLMGRETDICTGDIYIYSSEAESWRHEDESKRFYSAAQYDSKRNFEGIRLVEFEMVRVISTLVALAEKQLTKEELEKTSMRSFIESFKSSHPYIIASIEDRYRRAIDYINLSYGPQE